MEPREGEPFWPELQTQVKMGLYEVSKTQYHCDDHIWSVKGYLWSFFFLIRFRILCPMTEEELTSLESIFASSLALQIRLTIHLSASSGDMFSLSASMLLRRQRRWGFSFKTRQQKGQGHQPHCCPEKTIRHSNHDNVSQSVAEDTPADQKQFQRVKLHSHVLCTHRRDR